MWILVQEVIVEANSAVNHPPAPHFGGILIFHLLRSTWLWVQVSEFGVSILVYGLWAFSCWFPGFPVYGSGFRDQKIATKASLSKSIQLR